MSPADGGTTERPVVFDYATGDQLEGGASADLITASFVEPSGTGVVAAYRDEVGVWQHVTDDGINRLVALGMHVLVRGVYVLIDEGEPR